MTITLYCCNRIKLKTESQTTVTSVVTGAKF